VRFSLTATATAFVPSPPRPWRPWAIARVDLSARVAAALTGTRLVLRTASVWCIRFITTMVSPDGQLFRVRVSTGMCAWDFWML
jgi:hypothetical protein